MPSRYPLINSAVAFACALLLTTTAHEFAHGLTAVALGLQAVVHAGDVSIGSTTASNQTAIALAGPLFSLISGLGILALPRRGGGFWRLLLLWLGLLGAQNFFGYLMTGPFVPFGDIGEALKLLAAPAWAYAGCFLVGCAGTIWLGRVATRRLLEMTDPRWGEIAPQLRRLGLFAWLIGVALVVSLGLSGDSLSRDHLFEIVGALSAGIFLTLIRFFMRRLTVVGHGLSIGFPRAGISLLLVLLLVRHFILEPGVQLP